MVLPRPADELLLTARWVLPVGSPPIEDGAVLVRADRIARVGSAAELGRSCAPTRRLGEAAILPGLVNVHTHLELTLLRGLCEEHEFFPWIRRLTGIKYERLDHDAFQCSARWGVVEALRSGITTVADAGDRGVVLDALLECGLRGIVYQEVFGPDPKSCDTALEELERLLEPQVSRANDRVAVGVSPHAPYTVSPTLLRGVAELARERGLPLCVHVAESAAEGSLLRRGDGPFAEHLRARGIAWSPPGISPVAHLARLGVLGPRSLLIHAIDIDADDISRLGEAETSVAHCPKSNAKLQHGIAPLRELLAAGVRVGIGTDGVVSNNVCDLIDEARFAELQQRSRSLAGRTRAADPSAILRLMTLGGAEALGLDAQTGSIEPGKKADLTVVDLSGVHLRPLYRPETALVYGASGRDVLLTMVDGRVLYERGKVTVLDEEALRREVDARAEKLR